MAIPAVVAGGLAVAVATGSLIRGWRKVRRRRRMRTWESAAYPPREQLAARRRERSETFTDEGEFTMGEVKERLHGWNG
jgi:hypothetical protein